MKRSMKKSVFANVRYQSIFDDVSKIIDVARGSAARSVNAAMTAAYWLIGKQIVEFEQEEKKRTDYGEEIIRRLAADLSAHYGCGFSHRNVLQMKAFYFAWPISQTASAEFSLSSIASHFPLPWSTYVRLLSVKNAPRS